MSRHSVVLLLLLCFFLDRVICEESKLLREAAECSREEEWGSVSLVCDPHGTLGNSTKDKLHNLLAGLGDKMTCSCPGGCVGQDGKNNYVGLILVTDSKSTANLSSDATSIFKERRMGDSSCSHGLLLLYLHDTRKLASFRGDNSFVLLTDEDMQKLHELAAKGDDEGDSLALQYLLNNYKSEPIQKAETWTPLIGLLAAILVVLLALALLLALFLAKFCCCRNKKKEIYHVTNSSTYKTIDPIYVVTPPQSDRFPLRHGPSDGLYSTTYSGSPAPLSFPPPPGSLSGGSGHRMHPGSLNGGTPESRRGMRIQRMQSEAIRRGERVIPAGAARSLQGEGDYDAVPHELSSGEHAPPDMYFSQSEGRPRPHRGGMPMMGMAPAGGLHPLPLPPPLPLHSPLSVHSDADSYMLAPSLLTESDLPFLDPHRKLETQTREEVIY